MTRSSSRSRRREGGDSSSTSNGARPVTSPPVHHQSRDPIELFSAPTVDTLDDYEDYARGAMRGAALFSTNTSSDTPQQQQQSAMPVKHNHGPDIATKRSSSTASSTPSAPAATSSPSLTRSSTLQFPKRRSPTRPSIQTNNGTNSNMPPRPPAVSARSRTTSSGTRQQQKRRKKKKKRKHRDFSFDEDKMTVSVRTVDVATRSAFEPVRLVSTQEWQALAATAEPYRKTSSTKKRISPSLQHLELLHKFQRISSIRQLNFSPSVGLESDIFVPWDDDLQSNDNDSIRRRRISLRKRDGRYRSIDPMKATLEVLPSHPPMLSNRKRRLPIRSDVGFPNASVEEIQLKQQEIAHETEWEEASPRLVVLVTSDHLGTAVQDESIRPLLPQHEEWNGGGLDGMPLAGPELLMAKERNQRLFDPKQPHPENKWKPRRTSMLAPPLDASSSSTVGWRPRPFHDRPAGMVHCLACPISVNFEIGNVEPLVCNLALYSLPPPSHQSNKGTAVCGKLSEEFWFPAGDWKGLVHLEAARALMVGSSNSSSGGGETAVLEESWHHRKHKAIFSYDPLATSGGAQSLHVVLQVYKVSQVGAASPYHLSHTHKKESSTNTTTTTTAVKRKKGIKGRIKRKLGKMSKGGGDHKVDVTDVDMARERSKAMYDTFGTQFLTPLCFGVLPFFPSDEVEDDDISMDQSSVHWPKGATDLMQLYAYPDVPESQDDFVERLAAVAAEENHELSAASHKTERIVPSAESSPARSGRSSSKDLDEETSTGSNPSLRHSHTRSSTPLRRTSSSRRLKKVLSHIRRHSSKGITSVPIAGTASLFTSLLAVDFTQSMLVTPPAIASFESEGAIRLPRLLVDVSGDFGIMVNPIQSVQTSASSSVSGNEAIKKRSNLVRLPQSSKPAAYAGASELREMLYLPPRVEKQYDVDVPGSSRSFLNLLYFYPRLIRFSPDENGGRVGARQNKNENQHYSVRIRLVKNTVRIDEKTGVMETFQEDQESFHNPAPWTGPSMLKAVYTKIPHNSSLQSHGDALKTGIPMRDEIKLRLPMVLDGNHFLEFTLFAVELCDEFDDDEDPDDMSCFITMDKVAETVIPLSSSSSREASSGVRVTTVIPNGCHRLKLGDFQLLVETRLVSSIHVNDATVATALRDFPYCKESDPTEDDKLKELALAPSRSIVGKSSSTDSIMDIKLPFHNIFASASESSLLTHFPLLAHMHLCNMVNRGAPEINFARVSSFFDAKGTGTEYTENDSEFPDSTKFLMDNMCSFLEVVRKIKVKLCLHPATGESCRRAEFYLKNFADCFEEDTLSSRPGPERRADSGSLDALQMERSQSYNSLETPEKSKSHDSSTDDLLEDEIDEVDNADAIRLKNKKSVNSEIDLRMSHTVSALSTSGAPFSRVAYGASKTDRMRIEAELHQDGARFTQLFDDDETVVTLLPKKTPRNNSDEGNHETNKWEADEETIVDEPIHDTETASGGSPSLLPNGNTKHSLGDIGLAKRVRTAAQIMIAPCMAPNLSAVLATGKGSSPAQSRLNGVDGTDRKRQGRTGTTTTSSYSHKSRMAGDSHCLVPEVNICSHGSDVDDKDLVLDGDPTISRTPLSSTSGSTLRGQADAPLLASSVWDFSGNRTGHALSADSRPFVYETVMVLWLSSWLDYVEKTSPHNGEDRKRLPGRKVPLLIIPNYDSSTAPSDPIFSFFAHMDILLPLCLKSLVLRCSTLRPGSEVTPHVAFDNRHLKILDPFVEMLARGLLGQALSGDDSLNESDSALLRAISSTDLVLEFLIGLFAVVHPEHVSLLISKFFRTLRKSETEDLFDHDDYGSNDAASKFVWTENSLRRARSSRQLRLRAVEKLSILPNFVALNCPLKYAEQGSQRKAQKTSWKVQTSDIQHQKPGSTGSLCLDEWLPRSGWLTDLLVSESLLICSLSCEAVVAEAMAQVVETSHEAVGSGSAATSASLRNRPGKSLKRQDLMRFQSMAIHAINCTYELLLRRHAMDARFQTEQCRTRIAALCAPCILEKSLASVRWLARMEATHKVRSLWLLCFVYVLQEAPHAMIREQLKSYCHPQEEFLVHRFIRLLRLSSSTFQCFVDPSKNSSLSSMISEDMSSWLLQESFNTICAATNILVDECVDPLSAYPRELKKMAQGVLDLLLHMIAAPQSSVTHLRALGGALQALNKFGVSVFLEVAGGSLQHWVRVVLTLMNSLSLSVRAIATDFVISLLGSIFNLNGNIDEISLVFMTVLPEVMAREIALYGVNGLLAKTEDIESSVWPLRRALADIEDANPLDDDRVDPQLAPVLAVFCRACQAVIDGVLIELRLKGNNCAILGSQIMVQPSESYIFDADEESLFEAANFFLPETAPMQRLRWLRTLQSLHESKGQYVEAAEALILCARTISDAIPHLRNVWRPSRFVLWHDHRRSLWLSTIGRDLGHPDRGNAQVMEFAENFLEPQDLFDTVPKRSAGSGKLQQPTVPTMCRMLTSVTKEAVSKYLVEDGMDELAYTRLESLLKVVMDVLDEHNSVTWHRGMNQLNGNPGSGASRKRHAEEDAALRKVTASLNAEMTQLADRVLLVVEDESKGRRRGSPVRAAGSPKKELKRPHYVRVLLWGKKPDRFKESTTLPTFLEWDNPCICRIPKSVVSRAGVRNQKELEERICTEFGRPLRDALIKECGEGSILFRTGGRTSETTPADADTSTTYLDVSVVHMDVPTGVNNSGGSGSDQSKQFFYRKSNSRELASGNPGDHSPQRVSGLATNLVELTVAHPFPCALSRQRTLLTSEFLSLAET